MPDSIIHFASQLQNYRTLCGKLLKGLQFTSEDSLRVTCPECKAVLAGEKPAFEAPAVHLITEPLADAMCGARSAHRTTIFDISTCLECRRMFAANNLSPKSADNWPEMGDGPAHFDTKEALIANWLLNGIIFTIINAVPDAINEAVETYESFMRACDLRQKIAKEQHDRRERANIENLRPVDSKAIAEFREATTADERLEKTQS